MDRRLFLRAGAAAAGGAAAVVTLPGLLSAAGAAGPSPSATRTVWRLNPDWGYPLGKFGQTGVRSNASRRHAQNKIFATEADAIAGRLSPCSLAPAYPVTVCVSEYHALFASSRDGGASVDLRYPGVAEVWTGTTGVCATGPGAGPNGNVEGSDGTRSGTGGPGPAPSGPLPFTGLDPTVGVATAAAAILVGGGLAVARRRHRLASAAAGVRDDADPVA